MASWTLTASVPRLLSTDETTSAHVDDKGALSCGELRPGPSTGLLAQLLFALSH